MTERQQIAAIMAAAQAHGFVELLREGDSRDRLFTREMAARRLARYGSVESVLEQLDTMHAARIERAFVQIFRERNRAYYSGDAFGRQTHIRLANRIEISQGLRASMLLIAVEDARLKKPDAAKYRVRLRAVVNEELSRRFPRSSGRLMKATERSERSRHQELVAQADAEADALREQAVTAVPDLARQIDEFTSGALKHEVGKILDEMEGRLKNKLREGWSPNPERWRRTVLIAAKTEALSA